MSLRASLLSDVNDRFVVGGDTTGGRSSEKYDLTKEKYEDTVIARRVTAVVIEQPQK